jgi:CubicO group peptidase (beta-lactamase class C family)
VVGRRFAWAALLALLAASPLRLAAKDLPSGAPRELGLLPDRLARIDVKMEADIRSGRIPGAVVLIARKGRIGHYKAFGMADMAASRAMERDSIFRVYSMTKPVVSVALMILYEEGKFQLTDPIEAYIPAFKDVKVFTGTDDKGGFLVEDAKRKPTIQDAMRHTLGLTNAGIRTPLERRYLELGISFTTLESLSQEMDLLASSPLAYQPGERWHYGKGHDVQAYLVERLSGMPLDKFLEERLFRPLGMDDTGYGVPAAKRDRVAQYDGVVQHPVPGSPGLDMRPETYERFATRPFGTSGLWSTAMDFARFSQMLLDGGELDGTRILSRKTVELMTQNHLPTNIGDLAATGDPGIGYGLGMSIALNAADVGNLISPGTFGWTGAATTSFMIDPREDVVAIVMAQKWPYDARLLSEYQTLVYQSLD